MADSSQAFEVILSSRQRHFPMQLQGGVSVNLTTSSHVEELYKIHVKEVFPTIDDSRIFTPPDERKEQTASLKNNFISTGHRDFLTFEKEGKLFGWFMGEQSDHATYYLRNSGILPDYQNQGLAKDFIPKFLIYLKDIGYERVTSQHKGDNPAVLIPMLKSGFILCGFEIDERWGPLFKMVKLLNDDRTKYFKERFI